MTLPEAIDYLLDEFHLGDYVYDVRSRAVESGEPFEGNSWDHPKVLKFAEAVKALQRAKEVTRG